MSRTIRCAVAYATRERQYLWNVEVTGPATLADAIAAARSSTNQPNVPWDSAAVGVFGEARTRSDQVSEGDRIELYRPLHADPRERRRAGVQKARRAARGSG